MVNVTQSYDSFANCPWFRQVYFTCLLTQLLLLGNLIIYNLEIIRYILRFAHSCFACNSMLFYAHVTFQIHLKTLWVIIMDIITWSLYLQLIQFTVTTVNSQGLLYNEIIYILMHSKEHYFCFAWSWISINTKETEKNYNDWDINKPQYITCNTYFYGSIFFQIL